MRLIQLVYASRLTPGTAGSELTSIVNVSQRNNARAGITGALCFNVDYFLQCLEGERAAVNATYHRILRDPRHGEPVILRYAEIAVRDFSGWSMGYVPSSVLRGDTVLRYAGSEVFAPMSLGPDASIALLRELRDLAVRLPGGAL
jgi:hypothetical protein